MIKIDFKAFIHQTYWAGWYYWNECDLNHKLYNSNCPKCNDGAWRNALEKETVFPSTWWERHKIYKMPMNNVLWYYND